MVISSWPTDPIQRSYYFDTFLSSDQKLILGKLARLAENKGFALYIVGGFVRDILLGILPSDLDVVVEGDGSNIRKTYSVSGSKDSELLAVYNRFTMANLQKVDSLSAVFLFPYTYFIRSIFLVITFCLPPDSAINL